MAEPQQNLNQVLDILVSQEPAPSVQNADLYRTPTDTQQSARATQLQSVFEQAYPELAFTVTTDTENQVRVVSKPREKTNVPAEVTVPKGFSSQITSQGIADLSAALEQAQTLEEKVDIAFKLNALVQTQKAYNFENYKNRAEAEFGVPDLLSSIEQVKRAEMASRFNPGNGMPSKERLDLLQSLGVSRTHAAQRIKEFQANDTSLAAAENLAISTIESLKAQHLLEGRRSAIDARDEKRAAREAAISSIDPNFVQGISIVRYNKSDPSEEQRRQIAESFVDGKLKLTEAERVLATASVDSLQGLYSTLKDPKDQELALRMLQAREESVTNATQAENNIKLFKAVFNKDPSNFVDASDISKRYRQKISEITAQSVGAGNKERDAVVAQTKLAYQREYLGRVVERAFQSDVKTWNGLLHADETAKAIFLAEKDPKKPMGMDEFINKYLTYNDGKPVQAKSASLQAIISSAYEALPRSVVLPIPSKDSVILDAQHRVARQMFGTQMQQLQEFTHGGFR